MGLNKLRKDVRAVSPVIAIILMVAITVVLASVLYVWVMSLVPDPDEADRFPTVEITLQQGGSDGDTLTFKHTRGDPLDWSKYKIVITNKTDLTDKAVMTDLSSLNQITTGESSTLTEASITGFGDIDYQKGKAYEIEVYNLKENERSYQKDNVICQ